MELCNHESKLSSLKTLATQFLIEWITKSLLNISLYFLSPSDHTSKSYSTH